MGLKSNELREVHELAEFMGARSALSALMRIYLEFASRKNFADGQEYIDMHSGISEPKAYIVGDFKEAIKCTNHRYLYGYIKEVPRLELKTLEKFGKAVKSSVARQSTELNDRVDALIEKAKHEIIKDKFEMFCYIYSNDLYDIDKSLSGNGQTRRAKYVLNNLEEAYYSGDIDKGEIMPSILSGKTRRLTDYEIDNLIKYIAHMLIVLSDYNEISKIESLWKALNCYVNKTKADKKVKNRVVNIESIDIRDIREQIRNAIKSNNINRLPVEFFEPIPEVTRGTVMNMIYNLIGQGCKECTTLEQLESYKVESGGVNNSVHVLQLIGRGAGIVSDERIQMFIKQYTDKADEIDKVKQGEKNMNYTRLDLNNIDTQLRLMGQGYESEEGMDKMKTAALTVDLTKYNSMTTHDEVRKLRNMSIMDIERYGSDIQEAMSESSKVVLSKVNMIELGGTQEYIDELGSVVKQHKKLLPILQSPLRKLRKFSNSFVKVQGRLDEIEGALEGQCDKIGAYLEFMEEQQGNLGVILKSLRTAEDSLADYAGQIQNIPEESLKYQSVTNRLRTITDTRVIAEQTQAEALMIIGEQREVRQQLEAVIRNAIPALHIQAVNSVGIRVTKETQEIINRTRELTSDIIVQNAKDVGEMAKELQQNRTKSIVDGDKLMKAQSILTETMKIIADTAEHEALINQKLSDGIRETAKANQKYIEQLAVKNYGKDKTGNTGNTGNAGNTGAKKQSWY